MNSNYEMWFTYDGSKEKMQLPVLPETITVTFPDKNDSVYVYGIGEVTIPKAPGAFIIKFSSYFPDIPHQGTLEEFWTPEEYVDFMNEIMEREDPVKFIFTGGAYPISTLCTINFEIEEKGEDSGTIYYNIKIKEYKRSSVRKIKVKKGKAKKKGKKTRASKGKASTYKTKAYDTLWNIAKKFYGNGAQWTKIYNANKKKIGSNSNNVKAGIVLTIPK